MEKSKLELIIELILVFCLSIFILIVTLMNSEQTIYTTEELKHVELGFPLKYVVQNQSGMDPPLPMNTGIGSPLEHPIKISWLKLAISFLIVYIGTFVIIDIIIKFLKKNLTKV